MAKKAQYVGVVSETVEGGLIMTLKEFAKMLDGRPYDHEITKEEEALAKELGFVVVFGYSDDCAELRGAIDDEISCFNGGLLEHDDLPSGIYANWHPEDIDCAWAYDTSIPHECFNIYEDGGLYCVGIVCDINKKTLSNADRIRAMNDADLAHWICKKMERCDPLMCPGAELCKAEDGLANGLVKWLKQPAEEA